MAKMKNRVLIIAEVGVNHNGDLQLAKKIVDSIANTDIDIIKFQTAVPELLMVETTPKASYQQEATGSEQTAFEMIEKLQFAYDELIDLKKYVEATGKQFLSTAFDHESLAFLSDIGIKLFKIPSGEITNLPYLRDVAKRADDIILSTGMCELNEVEAAVTAIVDSGFPKNRITVLQCNTAYPTPLEDTNLRAMISLSENLQVAVGYSDHTEGVAASLAAVALGATVIEKHVTLDKSLDGPDHLASMEPGEFAFLVKTIREVEQTLGSSKKSVSDSEKPNIAIARRGLYAARRIGAGQTITEEDVIALRPEAIISPMQIDEVVGKRSPKSFAPNEPLTSDVLED